jgi:hypothetical protein
MPKKAVSVTLDEANVLWLKGRARLSGGNVSDALDKLITSARTPRGGVAATSSVMGMVDLSDDPLLEQADAAVRAWFDDYLAKPLEVHEDPPKAARAKKKRG